MHCFCPKGLNQRFFEILSNGAASKGPAECRKYFKKTLISTLKVIVQPLVHILYIALFFHFFPLWPQLARKATRIWAGVKKKFLKDKPEKDRAFQFQADLGCFFCIFYLSLKNNNIYLLLFYTKRCTKHYIFFD